MKAQTYQYFLKYQALVSEHLDDSSKIMNEVIYFHIDSIYFYTESIEYNIINIIIIQMCSI